jgi:mRNA deadenylase 3'-5' endonuclease subunit Ccr4
LPSIDLDLLIHCGSPFLLSVMPKDNIAVMVILEHRTTRTPLVVVNAHFTWDPQFADVKVVQALLLMQEVQSVLDTSPIAPKVAFYST